MDCTRSNRWAAECAEAAGRAWPAAPEIVLVGASGPVADARCVPVGAGQTVLQALNRAVEAISDAPGQLLLILDGAAILGAGSVRRGVATLLSAASIGAVAGRVVDAAGAVVDAGGILWADGSIGTYVPSAGVQPGEALFRRDVDHGGPCFLLTTRARFLELGGFDEGFETRAAAAAGFGASVWGRGLRVVYEPFATVAIADRAEEGAAGGARMGEASLVPLGRHDHASLRQLMLRLPPRARLPAAAANVLAARSVGGTGRRVMLMDGVVPLKAVGAGYPRTQAILNEAVALGWSVTFFHMNPGEVDWDAAYAELAPEIEICGTREGCFFNQLLERRRGHYDVVVVSRPDTMGLVMATLQGDTRPFGGARIVYDAEALFSGRAAHLARLQGQAFTAEHQAALVADELKLTAGADAVVAVTPAEAAVFRAGQTAPVTVLSHLVEARAGGRGFGDRSGFLFVGRLLEPGSPNCEGLAWFIDIIWPLIRSELGEVGLLVAGAVYENPVALMGPGVTLLGAVGDLQPLYDQARLFISPTRYAAGVSIKVLEASAAGLPVLATGLIAGQLGWTNGTEIIASDDAGEMAFESIAPYRREDVWTRIRDAAVERVEREHGRVRFHEALREAWGG